MRSAFLPPPPREVSCCSRSSLLPFLSRLVSSCACKIFCFFFVATLSRPTHLSFVGWKPCSSGVQKTIFNFSGGSFLLTWGPPPFRTNPGPHDIDRRWIKHPSQRRVFSWHVLNGCWAYRTVAFLSTVLKIGELAGAESIDSSSVGCRQDHVGCGDLKNVVIHGAWHVGCAVRADWGWQLVSNAGWLTGSRSDINRGRWTDCLSRSRGFVREVKTTTKWWFYVEETAERAWSRATLVAGWDNNLFPTVLASFTPAISPARLVAAGRREGG